MKPPKTPILIFAITLIYFLSVASYGPSEAAFVSVIAALIGWLAVTAIAALLKVSHYIDRQDQG